MLLFFLFFFGIFLWEKWCDGIPFVSTQTSIGQRTQVVYIKDEYQLKFYQSMIEQKKRKEQDRLNVVYHAYQGKVREEQHQRP